MYLNFKNINAKCLHCKNVISCNKCIFGDLWSDNTRLLFEKVSKEHIDEYYITEDIFKCISKMPMHDKPERPDHFPKTFNIKNLLKYWMPVKRHGRTKQLEKDMEPVVKMLFGDVTTAADISHNAKISSFKYGKEMRRLDVLVEYLSTNWYCLCLDCARAKYIDYDDIYVVRNPYG